MFKRKERLVKAGTKSQSRGFSLVELIVVVAVMLILVAIISPVLMQYGERSRAQKDASAVSEVANAVMVSLTDDDVFNEVAANSIPNNYSCYIDSSVESDHLDKKVGSSAYTFSDSARTANETPYYPAGNMRGLTITFKPSDDSGGPTYLLSDAVVNKFDPYSAKKLSELQGLYNAIQSIVGESIDQTSQMYRNSEYTIFINVGDYDAVLSGNFKVYGQYSGTNISASDASKPYTPAGGQKKVDVNSKPNTNEDDKVNKDEEPVRPHEHIYRWSWSWVEEGVSAKIIFTCSNAPCDFDGEEIDVGFDEMTYKVINDATCKVEGKGKYETTVSFNGVDYNVYTEVAIPKLTTHTYSDKESWEWANDKSKATLTLTCDVCSEPYVKSDVKSAVTTTPAKCGVAGNHKYSVAVNVNGKDYSDEQNVPIPALTHSYVGKVTKEATCTEKGVKTFTCSSCPDSYTESIGMIDHVNGQAQQEDVVEATCTKDGKYNLVVRCTKCNEKISSTPKVVAATGIHVDNIKDYKCDKCGISLLVLIDVPTASGTLIYTGNELSPTWSGYDTSKMTISGTTSEKNAGTYSATFKPNAGYAWPNGSTDAKNVSWTIDKAGCSVSLSHLSGSVSGIGKQTTFTVTRDGNGDVSATSSDPSIATTAVNGNKVTVTSVGVGNATITVSVAESANHKASNNATYAFAVDYIYINAPTQSVTLTYTGTAQSPTWSGYDVAKMTISSTNSATNAGTHYTTFALNPGYAWVGGSTAAKNVAWAINKAAGSVSLSASSGATYGIGGTTKFTVSRDGDGAISVSSSNNGIATASLSGSTVTVRAAAINNSATITVYVAAGTNHNAASATYSVACYKGAATVRLYSEKLYGLTDVGLTNSLNMKYYVLDGMVYVTAKTNDGCGYTNGRAYLEAGKTYVFNCTTDKPWISDAEAFFMLDGDVVEGRYFHMGSNVNYTFTPTVTGTYWLRLDSNNSGQTVKFSNISIQEVETREVSVGSTIGTLPTPTRQGYTFSGWFNNAGQQYSASTVVTNANDITLYAKWPVASVNKTYLFNDGDQCPSISGGWVSVSGSTTTPVSGSVLTGEYWYAPTTYGGYIRSANMIDLTNYTTIKVMRSYVSGTTALNVNTNPTNAVDWQTATWSDKNEIMTLDVSKLTGYYYLWFSVSGATGSCGYKVSHVWLE